jgi:hypothetical protein
MLVLWGIKIPCEATTGTEGYSTLIAGPVEPSGGENFCIVCAASNIAHDFRFIVVCENILLGKNVLDEIADIDELVYVSTPSYRISSFSVRSYAVVD